ncbi:LTA synthase family protein [uncultured Oscillibacter sp.]|uniref:LTA synthase family protein n=1 Tax=uncultured Oscillibacter sp. TaxID=876091 RepID=UPI00280A6C74|nr:LTA synthase family protein [uncultured Oscillibacter sp.]
MKASHALPKARLPLWATLAAMVALSGCITLLALWCQPNALRTVVDIFRAQPLLIVLNALPIGLLVVTFTCLFRNVFFGAALVNFGVCVLSIANRIKLEVRDEPVFPRDFALLKEVGSAMESYDIQYPMSTIAVVLMATLALVVLGLFIGCRPFPLAPLRGWLGRLLGAAGSMGILVALLLTVYASNDLYNSFRVSNAYYIPSVFNELGFPYCFCHQFNTYPIDRPEGFDKATAASWETGDQPGQGEDVHLIMVMNEAFSDLTDDPAFTYTEENDPLPNLHALQSDPHAVSGHVVVPGFAGGTANTEFDVLTGMQTNALSASTTSSFRVVNRDLDSVLRVFASDGYHTSFFHPGDDWFYNRENVYDWLGAEETVFVDEMENLTYKGRWVTDDYMAGFIEAKFEESVAQGELLCNYTTTIQNHMSYTADKYGEGYVYPPVETDAQLTDDVRTMLEVYIEGARDADAMLGRLMDYFSQTDEPVVLAFWGDHLPYLGDNQLAYAQLGSEVALPESERVNTVCSYETPYVIWANDAAAEALDWESAVESLDLPETNRLSASFLGAALLELTGRGEENPWFAFLNQLRRELPVVQKKTYMTMDGTLTPLITSDQLNMIDQWRQWSYYKLRYKEVE